MARRAWPGRPTREEKAGATVGQPGPLVRETGGNDMTAWMGVNLPRVREESSADISSPVVLHRCFNS
jgi:hypothetical protein